MERKLGRSLTLAAAFTLKLDTSQWQRALDQLGKSARFAVARGLNRTGASERTAMARAVSQDMGIKVGAARDAIKVEKANAANLSCRVVARGKPLPLIDFKARGPLPSRGRGRGVSYVMQGQRKTIAKAFIAVVGSGGHKGVFLRKGKGRLPIRELYGASIAHVFGNLIPVGEARRADVLQKNVAHEIEFELSRLKA